MKSKYSERLTQRQKDARKKEYYRERIDRAAHLPREASTTSFTSFGDGDNGVIDQYRMMQIWYDLYNGKVNRDHFVEYCGNDKLKAYAGVSENLVNRDIVSSRINTVIGVEAGRPFKYQAIAVNPEATTQREQKETELLKSYIMQKIQGQDPQKEQLPPHIRRYMSRKYQVPQEIMANQVLNVGWQRQDLENKFMEGLKHYAISSRQVYYVGPKNGEPCVEVTNPLDIYVDLGSDNDKYQLANSITAVYMMHPSEICQRWKDELTNDQIDRIWDNSRGERTQSDYHHAQDTDSITERVRVVHRLWRGQRKVGVLEYIDENGVNQKTIVSDNYRLNKEYGDKKITWEWVEEIHGGFRILNDIYVECGPVKYQHVLPGEGSRPWMPYVGRVFDNMNTTSVSLMGRMVPHQYSFNIITTKIDELISKDKGKKIGIEMSAIPNSLGVGLKELIAHMEEDDLIPMNRREEGKRGDQGAQYGISSLLSAIDLSPTSQINIYDSLADVAERRAATAIGITPQMEGFVKEREAAANVERSVNLSSSKLAPFYTSHDAVKVDVLNAYVKLAQLMYYENPPKHLAYTMDDMSVSLLELDPELFLASSYVITINNSSKTHDAKDTMDRYLQAGLQTQQVSPTAAFAAMRADSFLEAEEILEQSEQEKQAARQQELEAQKNMITDQHNLKISELQEEYRLKKELMLAQEKQRTVREIARAMVVAAGFQEDADMDGDGVADSEELGNKVIEKARKEVERAEREIAR